MCERVRGSPAGRKMKVAEELRHTGQKETSHMVLIKVTYDAYNQEFRLLDPKLARLFEDGETYVLTMDFLSQGIEENDGHYIDLGRAEIGHA
jgi:hypothetical protein